MTRTARWFWAGVALLLLPLILLQVFALIREGQQWAQQALEQQQDLPPVVRNTIQITLSGGETLHLTPGELSQVQGEAADWLARRQQASLNRLSEGLDPPLQALFEQAGQRIPDFADWYYSLSGEYLRLYHAVAGDLPAFLGERIQEYVFRPAGTETGMDRLVEELDVRLARQLNQDAQAFRAELTRLLHEAQTDAPPGENRVRSQWDLAGGLSQGLEPLLTLTGTDLARQGVATGAGAAASALVFKKLGAKVVAETTAMIAAKQSTGMLAALAAKLGLKSAAKGGVLAGAGSGAAAGGALCAGSLVGAPLSPACALLGGALAGATTWVLVDKAVLETDELINREQLEQDMRESLDRQRQALREQLLTHYGKLTKTAYSQMDRVMREGQP